MSEEINLGSLTIRPMTLDDVAQAAQIDRMSFSLPWSEYSFKHEVAENENTRAYVAELKQSDGKSSIAGLVIIWLVLDEVHVGTIAVHPENRRMGIGRLLMVKALQESAEQGSKLVYLEVRRSNLAAIRMYQEFGFQIVGERKKYYQDNGEDALLMTLPDLGTVLSKF